MRKVTVQKGICTQGLSLILVVLFSTYTELETLFSFISIIKVTTVSDHRYLEKRINIVGCWCIISTQWVKFFCWPWEDSLPVDKKVQRSNRKAFVIWRASRWLGDEYRGPAPFHRLTPNKRFEPVFSTVIMAVCSLFNRMLLLTNLIPVHLLYCGQTVMIGCNHTSFEWTRVVRHIYGKIRHMQGLYWHGKPIALWTACYYKASLENSLSGVYNIVLGFSVLL